MAEEPRIKEIPEADRGKAADLLPLLLRIENLPCPDRGLCGNGESLGRIEASLRATQRTTAKLIAAQARVEQHPVQHVFDPSVPYFWKNIRVGVRVVCRYAPEWAARPLDDDNLWRGLKSTLDGLQDARIVANDRQFFLDGEVQWVKATPFRGGIDLTLEASPKEVLVYDSDEAARAERSARAAGRRSASRVRASAPGAAADRVEGDTASDRQASARSAARPELRRRPAAEPRPEPDSAHRRGDDADSRRAEEAPAEAIDRAEVAFYRMPDKMLESFLEEVAAFLVRGGAPLPLNRDTARRLVAGHPHFASLAGVLEYDWLDGILAVVAGDIAPTEVYAASKDGAAPAHLFGKCPMCHFVFEQGVELGNPAIHHYDCAVPTMVNVYARLRLLNDDFLRVVAEVGKVADEIAYREQAAARSR